MKQNKLVFVISGTTQGLGKSLAKCVFEHRHGLIEINRKTTGRPNSILVDLSDPKKVVDCLQELSKIISTAYPNHKVAFISNAGIIDPVKTIGNFNPDEIVNIVNVNLIASLIISNYIAGMKNTVIIVNITSGARSTLNKGLSLYSATKAGLYKFIEIANLEMNEQKMTAVSYDPRPMDTRMQEVLRKSEKTYLERRDEFRCLKVQGKLQKPEKVAEEIVRYTEKYFEE